MPLPPALAALGLSFLPLPAIDYRPETGLAGGGVLLTSARPFPSATRPTTLELEVTLTARGQRLFTTDLLLFAPHDRALLDAQLAVMRFPEDVWGTGPDTPASARERYNAHRTELAVDALHTLSAPGFFLGPSLRLQSLRDLELVPGGLLDTTGARDSLSVGLGYAATWETRARPLTPAAGERALTLRQRWFHPAWGSDHRFVRHEVDLRTYHGLGTRGLLALQGTATLHSGADLPPFRMLALLGGETITRGYYEGRYRDRHLLATQAELRWPLCWRLGVVAFAGVGEVTPALSQVHQVPLRPTLGGGLRVRVDDDEGTNLRADVAVGHAALGVYFSFGEAF